MIWCKNPLLFRTRPFFKSFAGPFLWVVSVAFLVSLTGSPPSQAQAQLPPGELPASAAEQAPRSMKLISGKLFRIERRKKNVSYTSEDGGKTWDQGGRINPYNIGQATADVHIQIQKGKYRGRIVAPYYLVMDGQHPDYTRKQRGGYGIWKGEHVPLETHTYVPEMAGTFMCYSDDDGTTWQASKGFVMGYFQDGHLGHWSCEEPTVAELKDGRLLCFMRSTTGRILKSYTKDGGEYWSKVEATDIAMSNSPGVLKRIPTTGDLALVWNQMSAGEIRRGYRRGRLSIAISKDDGDTWTNFKILELSPGVAPLSRVEPEPLQAMVRGPQQKGVIPDGFKHFHYPQVYVDREKIYIFYRVSTPGGALPSKWRVFPISWLYED